MPRSSSDYEAVKRDLAKAETKFAKKKQEYIEARNEVGELRKREAAFRGGWVDRCDTWERDEAIRKEWQPGKRNCARDLAVKYELSREHIYRIIRART